MYSAAQLIRAQGVAATGVREVIDHSQAPRGSFAHYFPRGKDQLVGEAVIWAGDFAADWVRGYREKTRRPTPAGLFAHIVRWWKRDLAKSGYERGCPVMAAAGDLAGTESEVTDALRDALGRWESAIVEELVWMRVPRHRARRLAIVMLSALEGAIMVARVRRDLRALDIVLAELKPVLNGMPAGDRSGLGRS